MLALGLAPHPREEVGVDARLDDDLAVVSLIFWLTLTHDDVLYTTTPRRQAPGRAGMEKSLEPQGERELGRKNDVERRTVGGCEEQRCAGACRRWRPVGEFHVQRFRRRYPGRSVSVEIEICSSKCNACRTAKMSASAKRRVARAHALALARTTIRCSGPCRKEKAATEANFGRRPNGVFFLRCKVCTRELVRQYRRTRRYRRYLTASRRKREILRKKHETTEKAAQRRSKERTRSVVAIKARNALTKAISKGRVAVPECCAWPGCRVKGASRHRGGRRKLTAFFAHGYLRPFDVVFYCGRHHWMARHREEIEAARKEKQRDRKALWRERKADAERAARRRQARRLVTTTSERRSSPAADLLANLAPVLLSDPVRAHTAAKREARAVRVERLAWARRFGAGRHASRFERLRGQRAGFLFELYRDWLEPWRTKRVKDILAEEGWDDPGRTQPPRERVLGCWVETCAPT